MLLLELLLLIELLPSKHLLLELELLEEDSELCNSIKMLL